jgi:exo-1,4-beta-D-glucosaminidase
MKKIISIISLAFMLCLTCQAGRVVHLLKDGWVVKAGDKTYHTSLPATAMGVLMSNKVYDSKLFFGLNYKQVDASQFDRPWSFSNHFKLPVVKTGQHLFLKLDGLSYSANVLLNGKLIASRDSIKGAFRQYMLDITKYVSTDNELTIQVFRAQKGEANIGFVDWNPRPADESMGIFRNVSIVVADEVLMQHTAVISKVDTKTLKEAWLTVETELSNFTDHAVKGVLVGKIDQDITFHYPVQLAAGERKLVRITPDDVKQLNVKNPRLWWCNGMGKPEMYHLDMHFMKDSKACDATQLAFGIREIKDSLSTDGHRMFILNGRKVLLRGAGWTDDIFLRDTPESYKKQIELVKDMHLNTVRLEGFWGNTEELFNLCDRNGLMILVGWSCQWEWAEYVGGNAESKYGCIESEPGMTSLVSQLHDQVLWLRNHPCLIGWFIGSDKLPCPELEKRYRAMLGEIDNRPILISAQHVVSDISGSSGTKMYGPYEYVGPSYWYEDKKFGGAYGFNTETGIGAQLPVKESIERMIPSDKLWPVAHNDYYNYHCTASKTAMHNLDVLCDMVERRFGGASNLDDYLKKAHFIDYESTRAMFEAFRVNIDKCTGIVQWMLNSAWPSLYWQLYDYYGVPTASYYSVKAGNMPQQLIYNYVDRSVYAVNESQEPQTLKANVLLYNLSSQLLQKESAMITIPAGKSVKVFTLKHFSDIAFLSLKLQRGEDVLVARNSYCLTEKNDVYDYAKSNWYTTPITQVADYKSLNSMPAATVQINMQHSAGSVVLTAKNTSDKIAFFNEFVLEGADGHAVSYSKWSDNYVTLLPGESRILKCSYPSEDSVRKVVMRGWNTSEQTIRL